MSRTPTNLESSTYNPMHNHGIRSATTYLSITRIVHKVHNKPHPIAIGNALDASPAINTPGAKIQYARQLQQYM
jgi:hypothetical protein